MAGSTLGRVPRLVSFFLLGAALAASSASAQATRTWVSGVGDDANPCSRTAPCKTFAGAISKTAAGGAINVLDPGGFGAVTITKAITISSEGFEAGVLASGTNGIVVNAGPNDAVVLRGLDIEGFGTGLNGIRFLAGGSLHVEDTTINNFAQKGITFEPSGESELYVAGTVVRNTRLDAVSGGGILIKPQVGGSAHATLDDVRMENNHFGLKVEGGSVVTAVDTTASGNTLNGFVAQATAAGNAELTLTDCVAANNVSAGIRAAQAGAIIRLTGTTSTGNAVGLAANVGGVLVSFGNNRVAGNTSDGTPSSTIPEV